jgi:hypothetical protein
MDAPSGEVAMTYEARSVSISCQTSLRRMGGASPKTTVVYFACHAPGLRAFANTLDESFTIIDLREPKVGMGFWGRHGPETIVRRHGMLPVFDCAAPKTRRPWARLTGRR